MPDTPTTTPTDALASLADDHAVTDLAATMAAAGDGTVSLTATYSPLAGAADRVERVRSALDSAGYLAPDWTPDTTSAMFPPAKMPRGLREHVYTVDTDDGPVERVTVHDYLAASVTPGRRIVLDSLARGDSYTGGAERVYLTVATYKGHVGNLYRLCLPAGTGSRVGLFVRLVRYGVLTPAEALGDAAPTYSHPEGVRVQCDAPACEKRTTYRAADGSARCPDHR
jgi:DNA-binding NarL/FixJ family response regulator